MSACGLSGHTLSEAGYPRYWPSCFGCRTSCSKAIAPAFWPAVLLWCHWWTSTRLRRCTLCTTHLGCNCQLTYLFAHVFSHYGREAVVETGIYAGHGNFLAIVLQASPFANNAERGRTCH